LHDIGQWYVFRGKFDWAAQLFEKAQARGTRVSPLTLARCYWKLGQVKQAEEQFARSAAASEAPESYLALFRDRVAPTRRPTTLQLLVDNLQDAPNYEAMTRANSIAYRHRVDKEFAEAAELRGAVVDAARKRWPAGFPTLARFQLDYADLLVFMERYDDASRVAREVAATTALPAQRSRAASMLDATSAKTATSKNATPPEFPSTQPSAELAVMDSSSWTEQMLSDASLEAAKLREENNLPDAEIVQRAIVSRARELRLLGTPRAAAYLWHYATLLLRMEKFEEAQYQFADIYDLRMSQGDHAGARKVLAELNRMYTLWKRPELAAECDELAAASASLPKTFPLARRPPQPLAAPASAPASPL
jgi:hypothetical protein